MGTGYGYKDCVVCGAKGAMMELAETNRPFMVYECSQCGYYEEHRQETTMIGFVRRNDDELNPAMFRKVAELMDEELSKAQATDKGAPSPNTDEVESHSDSVPAAYNAFIDILENALERCHEPDVIKLLEKMYGSIEWEELAALGLVNPWAESVTEKYQQESSMTDEDGRYLHWKYGLSKEELKLTINGEDGVNVAEFADGAHSKESWDACQQYIAKLKVNDLMPQVGNVLKSLHGWNLHGCYGRDENQIIDELRAILSDLIGRIGEEQVKTYFAEMLEEQERELHAMEVEDGCCDCEIEVESEPYCHIFSEEEARANSEN